MKSRNGWQHNDSVRVFGDYRASSFLNNLEVGVERPCCTTGWRCLIQLNYGLWGSIDSSTIEFKLAQSRDLQSTPCSLLSHGFGTAEIWILDSKKWHQPLSHSAQLPAKTFHSYSLFLILWGRESDTLVSELSILPYVLASTASLSNWLIIASTSALLLQLERGGVFGGLAMGEDGAVTGVRVVGAVDVSMGDAGAWVFRWSLLGEGGGVVPFWWQPFLPSWSFFSVFAPHLPVLLPLYPRSPLEFFFLQLPQLPPFFLAVMRSSLALLKNDFRCPKWRRFFSHWFST